MQAKPRTAEKTQLKTYQKVAVIIIVLGMWGIAAAGIATNMRKQKAEKKELSTRESVVDVKVVTKPESSLINILGGVKSLSSSIGKNKGKSPVGISCVSKFDCLSGVCGSSEEIFEEVNGKVCLPPTCFDNVKNQNETGADVGGECGKANGSVCQKGKDCKSGSCYESLCVEMIELCNNGQKEVFETDIDCGGKCLEKFGKKCGINKNCQGDNDCSSALCLPAEKRCAPPEIEEWLHNDMQTDDGNSIEQAVNQIKNNVQLNKPIAVLKKITSYLEKEIYDISPKVFEIDKGVKTAENMISNSDYMQGCTDFGIGFVALARELGYPAIYVDTIELDLYNQLENGCSAVPANGHVFANVYFDGAWHVFNPTDGTLIEPDYGLITYCPDHNQGVSGCFSYTCVENPSIIGLEGCYHYNRPDIGEVKTVVITKGAVRKALSLWDMNLDNRDHANIKLHQSYGLPYTQGYCK
ncbi:transglutaminase family protein [Candidatus Falkowbacteria bacterium]|jgi:hypothetical protein|nr:transglutaminase family protein [Candidatus Falkowbacteria bacterium]MBT5502960.1 transglutaminase family protein [Candidatus Falkowbacteria bacterium]MBT6573547.1 transglutaminase family protein [Candidatus Falkowbacteria bacterium]MBT7348813.1 transglutaminase family protein [Candidatus Falkowbacteria bacterium]MBT7501220.1 transglutaminase family protein [Candidatus Falkowbacteria bacterium]